MIWKNNLDLPMLNQMNLGTMAGHLGIEFTQMGDDFLEATMPVSAQTVQPYRMLHGGASVVLAETLGSVASTLCIEDLSEKMAVGVEINANHLRSAVEGSTVTGRVKPLRVGRTMHVWNIEVMDEARRLVCVSRLTVAVVGKK